MNKEGSHVFPLITHLYVCASTKLLSVEVVEIKYESLYLNVEFKSMSVDQGSSLGCIHVFSFILYMSKTSAA